MINKDDEPKMPMPGPIPGPIPPPEPVPPTHWVLFDFYVGQTVNTIWGERVTIEECCIGRGGRLSYLVKKDISDSAWLSYDQIVEDRWMPSDSPDL